MLLEIIENYGYVGEQVITEVTSHSEAYAYMEANYSQDEIEELHVGLRDIETGEAV